MAKKPIVKNFDSKKDITLTTDATEHSISGILSQEEFPIISLSRRLTITKFNYSNIEKETLAVVWRATRAWQFLTGKKFLLRTDHRQLEFIFNPRKELPKVTTSMILWWAIRLMAFDFDIEYVKENSIPHVDALWRLRFYMESKDKKEFEDTFLHWVEIDVLSFDRMDAETWHDLVLSRITSRINVRENCSRAERPYKEIKHKLMIGHGMICNGDQIIPPKHRENWW